MQTIISPIPDPVFSYPFFSQYPKTAFFDIETTGLSPEKLLLFTVGMMYFIRGTQDLPNGLLTIIKVSLCY